MIRELLLPKDGGGSLRRFLAMRRRLFADQWHDSRPRRGPVPLFDFRRPDDVADLRQSVRPERSRGLFGGWRVSDDGVIGGYSSSGMEFVEGANNADGEGGNSEGAASSPPFLRWSGAISTEVNKQSQLARNITRSGFAAVMSPEFPFGAPLGNKYRALEICCRTDGRTYAVNLNVETYFPEDMYQGFITGGGERPEGIDGTDGAVENLENDPAAAGEDDGTPEPEWPDQSIDQTVDVRDYIKKNQTIATREDPNNHPYYGHPPPGFQRIVLPFRDFALTSRGRMRDAQRELDGAVNIESIGFTLMDGNDGDFCFDLVSLRAVNVMAGEVVGTVEEDAKEEELHRKIRGSDKKEEETKTEEETKKEEETGAQKSDGR